MAPTKNQIKNMIQARIARLIKESEPVNLPLSEWQDNRLRIRELDWALTLFK